MSPHRSSGAVVLTRHPPLLASLLVLAACGAVPPMPSEPAPVVKAEPMPQRPAPAPAVPSEDSAFEQRKRRQAEEAMQAGRWAEAAAQWEVLTLLRPERGEYTRKLTEAQSRAASLASESVAAAAEARRRGDLQRATTLYLKGLSADPQNATAASALRELEQAQSSRAYFNHATRPAGAARTLRASSAPYSKERQELDMAVMLFHQGDYGASVQSLQAYLKRYPQDEIGKRALRDAYAALGKQRIEQGKKEEGVSYLEKARATKSSGSADLDGTVQAARKDLAQDYYEQGLRVQRTDLEAAIRLWERALEYDPGHAQAKLRLAQGRRMQQSLQSLPNSKP
jgi:tetratricopeptide (TPR) repeat protein